MSEVTNNMTESRYELVEDGQTAFAAYEIQGEIVVFTHTIVPKGLEGRGIASRLIGAALADVRDAGRQVLPLCSFVRAYIAKHPDEADIVPA